MTYVDLVLKPESVHYEGGHWIGWSKDRSRILSVGTTAEAVRQAASRQGVPTTDVVCEWVEPANERFLIPAPAVRRV